MAINTQKFLPTSKSIVLAKPRRSLLPSSSTGSSGKLIKIEKKVIRIHSLIKNNLLLQKSKGQLAIREKENTELEKKEQDLEKEKPKSPKGIKVPKLPGFGFMGWIKNWIFNTILGFITVRLIEYLPKMLNFVKIAGPVMDTIINFSGMLLNGMVSFVDAGYKAVDATRGLVGKTFGEDALKNFDKLAGDFEKFMNLAIIVGMASADFGMDRLGKKSAKKAAEKGAGTLARRGASRVATRAGARFAGKSGAKLVTKIGSKALKAIPLLGAGIAIIEGIMRIKDGDYVGGLLSFGSAIPVAGWAFLALDIAREFMGGQEFDKSVGRGFGGKPGLTDKQVQQRTPHMSGPSFMGFAGGGAAPPVRRRVSKVKRKVSRAKAPVASVKPGSSIGGKQNIVKIFPENKKDVKQSNPLGYLEGSAKTLGKAPNFGPLFNIAMKTILGDKPTAQDYKNAGVGLNSWMSNKITNVGGFAGGGEVDGRMLFSGQDMSDAIASSIQNSISNDINRTIDDLMKQLMLKPSEGISSQTPGATQTDVNIQGGNADFWTLVAIASREDGDPQGWADVAQSIYNRKGSGAYGNRSIKEIITSNNQYEPTWQYPKPGATGKANAEWLAIQDLVTASAAAGQSQDDLKKVAAALLDSTLQKNSRDFIQGRIDFRGYSVSGGVQRKSGDNYFGWYNNYKENKVAAVPNFGATVTSSGNIALTGPLGEGKGNLSAAHQLALSMGLQMTSGKRKPRYPGDRSLHIQGRAMDFSNGTNATPEMLKYANAMISKYGSSLEQLIYTPLGYGISKGKKVPLSQWGAAVNNQHYNHVHVAFAAGGRVSKPVFALMGEKGQEFVFDADTTKGLDQMKPGLLDHLNTAKTKPQLASILKSYSDEPEIVIIPSTQTPSQKPTYNVSNSSRTSGSVNRQDNSWIFDRLATGTG
jgi:hypothetical protein